MGRKRKGRKKKRVMCTQGERKLKKCRDGGKRPKCLRYTGARFWEMGSPTPTLESPKLGLKDAGKYILEVYTVYF